jgi:hypothetical protein
MDLWSMISYAVAYEKSQHHVVGALFCTELTHAHALMHWTPQLM